MATIKAYTDLKQSKKLAEILPIESADMEYKLGSGKVGWMVSVYPDNCRCDSCWHDNPIDACYEMILKLHELNLL